MSHQSAPEEASAMARAFARSVRDMYVAMVAEGFTADEAMRLLGQVVSTAIVVNGKAEES